MTDISSAVIVGGSSGVGLAIAGELAARGCSLVIASRREDDLASCAARIRDEHGVEVWPVPFDVTSGSESTEAFVEVCREKLGQIGAVIVSAGEVDEADFGLVPDATVQRLMGVNLLGPIRTTTAFAAVLHEQDFGTITVFSSIAAPVPRTRNVVYSAAKNGLESYCLGLRHRFSRCKVRVQVYRLGYVDTPMAAGRTKFFTKVQADAVARHVVANLDRDRGLSYFPRYWALVVFVLRHLPWSVYRRLDF